MGIERVSEIYPALLREKLFTELDAAISERDVDALHNLRSLVAGGQQFEQVAETVRQKRDMPLGIFEKILEEHEGETILVSEAYSRALELAGEEIKEAATQFRREDYDKAVDYFAGLNETFQELRDKGIDAEIPVEEVLSFLREPAEVVEEAPEEVSGLPTIKVVETEDGLLFKLPDREAKVSGDASRRVMEVLLETVEEPLTGGAIAEKASAPRGTVLTVVSRFRSQIEEDPHNPRILVTTENGYQLKATVVREGPVKG